MEEEIIYENNEVQEFAEFIQIGNKVYKVKDLQGILDTRIPHWFVQEEEIEPEESELEETEETEQEE